MLTSASTHAGLGEEHSAKLKLRLGLNLRTQRAYAKLRFRTEPVSPFDIGDGLSCAGKVSCPALSPVYVYGALDSSALTEMKDCASD